MRRSIIPHLVLATANLTADTYWQLSPEQFGCYMRLLLRWRTGPMPDDDLILGRCCGVTRTKFARNIRPALLPFFTIVDGKWVPSAGHVGGMDAERLPRMEWRELRAEIFARDDYTCVYCRQRGGRLECDHVIPISRGGTNDPLNLATSCYDCNREKGDRTPEEWRAES